MFGALRCTQPPPRGDPIEAIRTCLKPECDKRGTLKTGSNTVSVKRVALIGATGSIGRQAIEIVAAHPGLELVAAASGSTPIDGLAPLTQTGGNLTELLERAGHPYRFEGGRNGTAAVTEVR